MKYTLICQISPRIFSNVFHIEDETHVLYGVLQCQIINFAGKKL